MSLKAETTALKYRFTEKATTFTNLQQLKQLYSIIISHVAATEEVNFFHVLIGVKGATG